MIEMMGVIRIFLLCRFGNGDGCIVRGRNRRRCRLFMGLVSNICKIFLGLCHH